MTQQISRHVEAVLAALSILDVFVDEAEMTLKELNQRTGMTPNRLLRLTGTLMSKGYLLRNPKSGAFSLGPKFLVLGQAVDRRLDLVALARPLLVDLARETGESVSVYVRDGFERVVLIREDGAQSVRHTVFVGQRMPLHAGAAGKVLLAFSPPQVLDDLLAQGALPRLTPETITKAAELKKRLAEIRELGCAASKAERDRDAFSVAAPVFKSQNELAGALSIAGPISRMTDENLTALQDRVVATARRLSVLLGGAPWGS